MADVSTGEEESPVGKAIHAGGDNGEDQRNQESVQKLFLCIGRHKAVRESLDSITVPLQSLHPVKGTFQ